MTREVAALLIEAVAAIPCPSVDIDFTGVDFISRSFADQFHKEKIKLWEDGVKEIHPINTAPVVRDMLKAVCRSAEGKHVKVVQTIPVYALPNRKEFKQLLSFL